MKVLFDLKRVSNFKSQLSSSNQTIIELKANQKSSVLKFGFKAFLRRPQNFAQSSSWFWNLLSKHENHEEDCANFCGLLRKAELYFDKLTQQGKLAFLKLTFKVDYSLVKIRCQNSHSKKFMWYFSYFEMIFSWFFSWLFHDSMIIYDF